MGPYHRPETFLEALAQEKLIAKLLEAAGVEDTKCLLRLAQFLRGRSIRALVNYVTSFYFLWQPESEEFLHDSHLINHVTLLQF